MIYNRATICGPIFWRNTMDMKKLQEELAFDEGVVNKIYLDHLGYPTFGIGHLIRETDPEHGLPVDTPVSEQRVTEAFQQDCLTVESDCVRMFANFFELPEDVQRVVANMMFNLGFTRLNKFNNFKAAIRDNDWKKAAVEGRDSLWYRQVTKRAERLMKRLENV